MIAFLRVKSFFQIRFENKFFYTHCFQYQNTESVVNTNCLNNIPVFQNISQSDMHFIAQHTERKIKLLTLVIGAVDEVFVHLEIMEVTRKLKFGGVNVVYGSRPWPKFS